jgi:hypothetical protein
MNIVEELFNKYQQDYAVKIMPATTEQIVTFIKNCKKYNVPEKIVEELTNYFKMNNNFFNYFLCDDERIFEWYQEQNCIWLGQRDLWTFRCLVDKHRYAIGDAMNESFGDNYEFDSVYEMLDSFLSGKTI